MRILNPQIVPTLKAMLSRRLATLVVGCALATSSGFCYAAQISIENPSFEEPVIDDGSWAPFPAGHGWSGNDLGIYAIGVDGDFGVPQAIPEGHQVKGLTTGGSFAQEIEFPKEGQYKLTFHVGGRNGGAESGNAEFEVWINDEKIHSQKTRTGEQFSQVEVKFEIKKAGFHELAFKSTSPEGTDRTAFIDAIEIEGPK